MSEDYAAIAHEAADAIASVGFAATITPAVAGPTSPWGTTPPGTATPVAVTVVDTGIKDIYGPGGLIVRRARVLLVGATFITPKMGDVITVRGVAHEIQVVHEVAPGGVSLMFKVEIAA